MDRIDKLIHKTEQKEETKKWIIYVNIGISILVIIGILCSLIWFADVDSYLEDKGIVKIYNTYDKKLGESENLIYYLGDSTACFSIYPPYIKEILNESGYNITLFGLSMGEDVPPMRVLQIQNIIESKPIAVIYALSYHPISDYEHWVPEYCYLVSDKLKIRNDSLYLFTKNQLEDINHTITLWDKRTFLKSALSQKLGMYKEEDDVWHDEDGTYFEIGQKRGSLRSNQDEILKAVKNPDNSFKGPVTNETNQNKEALLYFAKILSENNIPLILISPAINPLLADEVDPTSRQNLHDLFNSTGSPWYDCEYALSSDCFVDEYHTNEEGSLQFSELLAEIIKNEVKTDVIHIS